MRIAKILSVLMVLMLVSAGTLFARGAQEAKEEPAPAVEAPAAPAEEPAVVEAPAAPEAAASPAGTVQVNLAVFKGPTGFGYVKLIEEGPDLVDGISVESQVLPSPTEAIARLASGELDVVAMPVNAASSIYNKGIDVKLAAVTGEGMLYLMSSDPAVTDQAASLSGKSVNIPGAGSTPEYVPKFVLEKNGLAVGEDVEFDFSLNVAAQLTQMLIAGKVTTAVLPEPFATMAESKSEAVRRVLDFQEEWSSITGTSTYPMTALLIRGAFASEHPEVVRVIRMAVENSIDWVNANPADAAALIEKHEILTAALAQPAIPNCNLVYIDAADARASIEAYLEVLKEYAPASIGGSLPDEAFYMAN